MLSQRAALAPRALDADRRCVARDRATTRATTADARRRRKSTIATAYLDR